ncbi:MAG TPA: urate hydroxylase PuuD [Thermohalobaculum sp.]|nr:urate hydroxylase PuuD [Thermohalobaculum sp.]
MSAITQDWLSLFLRWAHIVAAIGWIGSSFYFMWLDASLRRAANLPEGVTGESWSVHGGGFYRVQKYAVAPERMPADLHWFKWESYLTWLSGFALMAVTYYWSASSYLLAPGSGLAPWQGVGISLAGLALGWVFYDRLCKSPLKANPSLMFAVLFLGIVAAAWAYGLVFSGRAAFLQTGAMIATLMTGNVFLVIIPNQKLVVDDLRAGRTPDPQFGEIAKLRSTHNNYLTLPVIFLMISNHYPMTFGHGRSWAIVALVLVMGAIVRHWFNRYEAGATGVAVQWQWPLSGAIAAALIGLTAWQPPGRVAVGERVTTGEALAIVEARCASCHAAAPTDPGFDAPPGGVALETPAELRAHAQRVLAQTVLSDAMPLGNLTGMTEQERARLGAWIRAGMPDE